jgi:hypothetical protein
MQKATTLAVLAIAIACGAARADEWDVATNDDDGNTTNNVLFHGSEQVHDLAAISTNQPDQDWYVVATRPFSSYLMVIDGMTGDLDLAGASMQLLSPASTTPLANAVVDDFGGTLSLTWSNASGPPTVGRFVRVQGASCGTTCTNADRYRIRFFDTTYTIPRFNNSGTQSTALIVQNATDRTCDVTYALLDAAGALVGFTQRAIPVRGTDVVSAAELAPNQSGSVRLAHTCGLGGISGKAVSVEPATGFSFDTQMAHRPH